MRKQKANTLSIMRPSNRLRQSGTDIHNSQLLTPTLLILERHRIGHHNTTQLTLIQDLNRVAGQDTVRDDGDDFAGLVRDERLGRFGERAASVGHVVDQDAGFVLDVADEDHAGDFVGAGALFVDEGEAEVEAVGYGCCSENNVSLSSTTTRLGYLRVW